MKTTILLFISILFSASINAKDRSSSVNKTDKVKTGNKVQPASKSGKSEQAGLGTFYYEGFDNYTAGSYLAVVDEKWNTWSNDPGSEEDGIITDEQALSESNSVKVDGSTDLILPMGNKTSGTYLLSFNVFLPTDKVGFFGIAFSDVPDENDFAIQCYFDADGVGYFAHITSSYYNITFTYSHNEWINVALKVDLDNDLAVVSIDGTEIYSDQWSNGNAETLKLGLLDIWAIDNIEGTPLMYFDDVLFMETETQQVLLKTGWNIMSFNVMPGNQNLMDILQPLIDEGKLKKVMDESGNTIEDWGVYGNWKNNIGNVQITEGYKINVTAQSGIEVSGIPMQFPFQIPLKTGWNIISWPSPSEQDGMEVFQSLIDDGSLKKVMDESGNAIEDWGIFGDWKNSIGNLMPGEGYNVNVNNDCVLIINETSIKSAEIKQELVHSVHFVPVHKGNGVDHMNINLVNLSESGLIEGDEIGIFDGNICVGSARISIQNSAFNIPVSANESSEDKNGYTDGNQVTLKLFRNGTEYPLHFKPHNYSKSIFEKGSSLFAKVNVDLNTGISMTSDIPYLNLYPNPFSDKLNFEFVSATDAHAVLEIFNTTGQSITRLLDRQVEEGVMNRVEYAPTNIISGVYIYKLTIDGNTSVGRVIYRK